MGISKGFIWFTIAQKDSLYMYTIERYACRLGRPQLFINFFKVSKKKWDKSYQKREKTISYLLISGLETIYTSHGSNDRPIKLFHFLI